MSMYVSVLDDESKLPDVTFSEAVMRGFAPDGGMYWPKEVPRFEKEELKTLAKKSYREQVEIVLSKFLSGSEDEDFTGDDLKDMFKSDDPFKRFGHKNVLRTKTIDALDLDVVELWHGPTLAFKDLGMCVLAHVLERIVKKRKTKLTLLVGTSGDTGSAAAEAVRGLDNINLFVLYPKRNFSAITTIQERQMTVVSEKESNVNCIAVEGGSDALDVPIENLFHSDAKRLFLGSVNSVNIVRLVVQTVRGVRARKSILECTIDCDEHRYIIFTSISKHFRIWMGRWHFTFRAVREVFLPLEFSLWRWDFRTVVSLQPQTRTVRCMISCKLVP